MLDISPINVINLANCLRIHWRLLMCVWSFTLLSSGFCVPPKFATFPDAWQRRRRAPAVGRQLNRWCLRHTNASHALESPYPCDCYCRMARSLNLRPRSQSTKANVQIDTYITFTCTWVTLLPMTQMSVLSFSQAHFFKGFSWDDLYHYDNKLAIKLILNT